MMRAYIILSLLFSSALGLMTYQGCSRHGDGGNGGPYTGLVPPDGSYYARVYNYQCLPGSPGSATAGITHVIDVSGNGTRILKTDQCSGGQTQLAAADLNLTVDSTDYLAESLEIYQRFDSIPATDEPIPLAVCYIWNPLESTNPPAHDFLMQKHIVAFFPTDGLTRARPFVLEMDGTTGKPKFTSLPLVAVTAIDTVYPPGSGQLAFAYVGVDYDLKVAKQLDSGLNVWPGFFSGTLLGQGTRGEAKCLGVANQPVP